MFMKHNLSALFCALLSPLWLSVSGYAHQPTATPAKVQSLIAELEDKGWVSRQYAAEALGEIGDKRAVEPLIAALKDKSSGVRSSAAEALGQIGDKRAVEPLIAALKDEGSYVHRSAAWALGEINDKRAIEPLIAALKNEDKYVRRSAAEALGKLRAKQAVELLIAALKDEYKYVRRSAAEALGKLGDKRAVEPLIVALKDKDVRSSAAEALENMKSIPKTGQDHVRYLAARGRISECVPLGDIAVEPLIATLKDEDKYVRRSTAEALGQIGNKRAVEPLIAALKDSRSDVRRSAAEALGKLRAKRAVEPLIAALKDKDVRNCTAEALGQIGDKRAVEPLIAELKHKDVRRFAASALGQIGDKRAMEPLIVVLKDKSSEVRSSAAKALGQIGTPAVAPLIAILKDEDKDWRVRDSAAEALGQIGTPAVAPLIAILKDEDKDWRVRESVAKALGQIGDKRAVEPLIVALSDEEVRSYAAEALDNMKSVPKTGQDHVRYLAARNRIAECIQLGDIAVEPLIAMLKYEDKYVRQSAAEALGQIGDKRAVEPLTTALKDKNIDVRRCAASALGEIGTPALEPLLTALKNEGVRRYAAEALGKTRSIPKTSEDYVWYLAARGRLPECVPLGDIAVEPLIAMLKNKFDRSYAAEALGQIGDKRAVEPLIAVLKDDGENVRRSIFEALQQSWNRIAKLMFAKQPDTDIQNPAEEWEQIGTPAVEALIALLGDKDARKSAEEAARQIGHPASKLLDAVLMCEDFRYAAGALGQIGDKRAVEPLIAALENEDIRSYAAKALGQIGDNRAVEPLIATLKSEDKAWRGREFATEALGQIGTPATETLIAAVKDRDFRSSAAEALGKIGAKRAAELLITALKDESGQVRSSAAEALGNIGDTRAVEPLSGALTDRRCNTAAAKSLQKVGWEPQTMEERIHFLIGLRDPAIKDVKNWPDVKTVLMQDARSCDAQRIEYALHAFTMIGNESSLPELLQLVRTIGTETIARAYVHCNQEQLRKAGRDWVTSHGHPIQSKYGGGETWNWGTW